MAVAVSCHVEQLLDATTWREVLAKEVSAGLSVPPRWLPAKLFYDSTGSALFERITELPEYYLTRAERALLGAHAHEVMKLVGPRDIVELGAGSGRKMRWLLNAADDRSEPIRYVPVDVDAAILGAAARQLVKEYPHLSVHGLAADFMHHLGHVPPRVGPRLVVFLGSTIGNLDPEPRVALISDVRGLLAPGDRFLLGVDLVKPTTVLETAYNDRAGVTAAFNRNILRVVNHHFRGDFRPDEYRHRAFYNADAARIEMHLVARARQVVHLHALGLTVEIDAGETLWTESSYKFTLETTAAMLAAGGLALEDWYTDWRGMFALALAGLP
jgi:L-histidine Nalpha-methyltransferase